MKYYLVPHENMDNFLGNEIRNARVDGRSFEQVVNLFMKFHKEVCKEFPFEYVFQMIINRFEDIKRLAKDGLLENDFNVVSNKLRLSSIRANAEDMAEMVERWRREYCGSGAEPESREKSREEELSEETIRALQAQVEPTQHVKDKLYGDKEKPE